MSALPLATIARILDLESTIDTPITGVSIDSRTLRPGHVFVALPGNRCDGHDFLPEVEAKGAIAAVVTHVVPGLHIPQFKVSDPVVALTKIATAHRRNYTGTVIALTGSNGKTTVKEMTAACLPNPSWSTQGNLNNHLGVPLSVLGLVSNHRHAVFELGANHLGEIARTVAIVCPDITLINNIAPAHVEGFGSIEGVARAKGEIHQGLSASGTAVVNEDDAYSHFWDDLLKDKKVIRFSAHQPMDVYAQDVQLNAQGCAQMTLVVPHGKAKLQLKVPGYHNISNALAAASCCFALGLGLDDITAGLSSFGGVRGRLTLLMGQKQTTVIDDTYNANLRSVLSALEVLGQRPGKRIFVFGDMGELGKWSESHHQEVGLRAKALGIEKLLCCGTYSALAAAQFGPQGQHFSDQETLIAALLPELGAQTTVLVKGSRSSAMEKIVKQIL